MTRTYFKTHLVHHCFSPEIYDASALLPQAKLREERFPALTKLHKKALEQKCSCRYFVSTEEAEQLKDERLAVPLIDNRGDRSFETIHLVVTLATKTPRSPTIEKAHIERAVFSDNGKFMQQMESEDFARFDPYRDIEIEERMMMFDNTIRDKLLEMKKASDRLGVLKGRTAYRIEDKIQEMADKIKLSIWTEDLFYGEPVLLFIGSDQRTSVGVYVNALDKEAE
jgi:hypothetical protein